MKSRQTHLQLCLLPSLVLLLADLHADRASETACRLECSPEPAKANGRASEHIERSTDTTRRTTSRSRGKRGEWRKKDKVDEHASTDHTCHSRKYSDYERPASRLVGGNGKGNRDSQCYWQGAATAERLRQTRRCRCTRDKMESRSGPRGQGGLSLRFTPYAVGGCFFCRTLGQ